MFEKYLRAKHWQLFLITILICAVTKGILELLIYNSATFPNFERQLNQQVWFYASVVFIFWILGWFWAVGNGLQQLIPESYRLNCWMFRSCVFFLLIYLNFAQWIIGDAYILYSVFNWMIIPSIIYTIHFSVKTIRTAELQRKPTIGERLGLWFMLIYYPIGFWFVQNRINQLVEGLEPPKDYQEGILQVLDDEMVS